MTFSDNTSVNKAAAAAIPDQPILLGSNPGAVLASLPSMMGFVPEESVVMLSLMPEPASDTRFRVGPVVRADLDPFSIEDAVDAISMALTEADYIQVLMYIVTSLPEDAEFFADEAEMILDEAGMESMGMWWAERIAEGAAWEDLRSAEQGFIGALDNNPMHSHSALHRARTFESREELEKWLDPGKPSNAIYPRKYVKTTQSAKECVDLVKDMNTIAESVCGVDSGRWRLEEECRKTKLMRALGAVVRDERMHAVIFLMGIGERAPIMREFLAEATRRTTTGVRRRLMVMLAGVMSANGEGMPAFHTLQRVHDELGSGAKKNELDALTDLVRNHLWNGHMDGDSKAVVMRAAMYGIYWILNFSSMGEDASGWQAQKKPFEEKYRALLERLEVVVDWEAMPLDVPSAPFHPERW